MTSIDDNFHNVYLSSMNKLIRLFFLGLIRLYQLTISPFLGANCRYVPTCSQYAQECFNRYSWPKALWFTIKRLGRCHPFAVGGYDPVIQDDQQTHHCSHSSSDDCR